MTAILTAARLEKAGACADQLALFRKMFGAKVEITEALCIEHAALFSWAWAAANLLNLPARAEYDRVMPPAWAEYNRVTAPARAEYERVTAPSWAEYKRVRAPAWAEYNRVMAAAWARAFIAQESAL